MGFTLKNAVLTATAILALSANAHMVMKTPVPLGKSTLNNSPLDPSGSDFPCKLRPGAFDPEGASNVMAIGESQTLSFTGSAVHGGGSCQLSLTTDLEPTKNSKWMVIKSIEGGCPASVAGNLPADPNGNGASTFQYSIPEGIAPGQYVLSWTWFNKIGNREMYQNCAGVQVTASKKRYSRPLVKKQSSFPDMAVCNLASINSCVTSEGSDYIFDSPGAFAEKVGAGPFVKLAGGAPAAGGGAPGPAADPVASQPPFASASGPAGGASQAATATGGGQPGFGPTSEASVQPPTATGAGQPAFASGPGLPDATAAPNQPATPATPSGNQGAPGVFATGLPQVIPVTLSTSTLPVQTGAPKAVGSGAAPATGACEEGAWECAADGESFRRCASGSWSTPISMAAGMSCTPGTSETLSAHRSSKRSHAHGHLRRRLSAFLHES